MALILKNIMWHVPMEAVGVPILGRWVLESIGCDNRAMWEAACDYHGGIIDVSSMLSRAGNLENCEGSIAALLGESIFHAGRQLNPYGMDENDVFVEFSDHLRGIMHQEF